MTPPWFGKLNAQRIIAQLHQHGPQRRQELAKALNVGAPTITRITNDLLEMGVLLEKPDPLRKGKKGFPTKILHLNATHLITAGVYFDPDKVYTCIANFHGEMLSQKVAANETREYQAILSLASEQVKAQIEQLNLQPDNIVGCGISFPGHHTRQPGRVIQTVQFSDAVGIDTLTDLPKFFDYPVFQLNDAKTAGLAELYYGACKKIDDFCYVWLSYGIGGAAIVDRQLYMGNNGTAAEFGRLFPKNAPRPSGQDLINFLNANGVAIERLDQLDQKSFEGPLLSEWISRSTEQLRRLFWTISATFSPKAIVLGGTLPEPILKQFHDTLCEQDFFPEANTEGQPILLRSEVDKSPELGAAVLPIYELIHPKSYAGRIFRGM